MTTRTKSKVIILPRKYVEAVNNGVKWLDVTFGRKEWLRRMDMRKFDIVNESTCVAGNVFQDAFIKDKNAFENKDGWSRFGELMEAIGVSDTQGHKFGFNANTDKGKQYLQDIWVRKIKALKVAAKKK